MSKVKELREKSGMTQIELAEKAGLSLRTIQRFEAGDVEPKGHSLKMLSKAFKVDSAVFRKGKVSDKEINESDKLSIKFINLSALGFMGVPFGNIIFPFILWNKKRQSKSVDEAGRKIINFQIIWTVVLCFLLCIAPFINIDFFNSTPLILIVLFLGMAVNLIVIFITAYKIEQENNDFLELPIKLL